MKRAAFTLIELLVSVAIFVVLLVIALGTFARSIAAIDSTADLREKSQVLRRVVDGIGNDWRYLYIKNKRGQLDSFRLNNNNNVSSDFYGFALSGDDLYLVLRYPSETKLVVKHYQIKQVSGRKTITLSEAIGCVIDPGSRLLTDGHGSVCVESSAADLLPARWALDVTGNQNQPFKGSSATPNQPGYLKLDLTLKAKEFATTNCSSLPTGSCYGVKTTFTQGLQ